MQIQSLGKNPRDVHMTPFGTLAFVQGWCPHCQHFHPEYEAVQRWMSKVRGLPSNFQMESVEAQPPHSVGDGVPALVMIFDRQVVPLPSRFWVDGDQLAMALYALYVQFFQRWKENQKRIIQKQHTLPYDDLVSAYTHPNSNQYREYNDFIASLPHFLDQTHR